MKFKILPLLFLSCLPLNTQADTLPAANPMLTWRPWSDEVFADAKAQKKFVLLDLEAIWCHWCHVMDEITYHDPNVIRLLESKYILVKVDQDSRPDLSNRYEDYGWPATIVFDADGKEIVKRQGYIPPRPMASMLQAIMDDPTPGPSVQPEQQIVFAGSPSLSADLRARLKAAYIAQYDNKLGGWGFVQKYLDWQSVEYGLEAASTGDSQAAAMAKQTLTEEMKLLDPAWGGVYQYSVGGDWNEPHFEKIMSRQSEDMRLYAEAYILWRQPEFLQSAKSIYGYLETFLTSPTGAFYTSQNADLIDGKESAGYFKLGDRARRQRGIPHIDKHIYARENGWAINATATLYGVTGDRKYLESAERALQWIEANRSLPQGGYQHGEHDASGPYLGDTLAMTRAHLTLYSVTGERDYLRKAEAGMHFIATNFAEQDGVGFLTVKTDPRRAASGIAETKLRASRERDENATLARLANLLWRYTGDESYRKIADQAMRYLATPQIAQDFPAAAVLLADLEYGLPPLHVTIVGHKDDKTAQSLFAAAAGVHPLYKRIEWWDTREGRLRNPDVQYPETARPAAFLCTAQTCSSPIYAPNEIQARVDRLLGKSAKPPQAE